MPCDYDDSDKAPDGETPILRSMSEAAKRRINRVAGDRCLIENTFDFLDHVHCLKRSTEDHLLDSLEFAWNMKPVYFMSPNFHRTFVMNSWLLLPETEIIDAYYNAINTRKLPNIAKVYQYTLSCTRENAGSKLDESDLLQWQARETRKDDLAKVVAIWNSWKQEVPTEEWTTTQARGKFEALVVRSYER
ncbi:hypothetical protein EDB85DRAFT_1928404 [Lactarius pseudohatsudake]|nr:hypothetical protein EDB85DRAFT_1928404 [Lactarius pseudohatsudake]